jgi:hypothetical protein
MRGFCSYRFFRTISVPGSPNPIYELSILKDLWVHFEATTTTTPEETLRGQEMQTMVRVDVLMPAPAQTPNALS